MEGIPLKSGADFHNHEATNMRLHNLGTDPMVVGAGLVYFNSVLDRMRLYTGGGFRSIAFLDEITNNEAFNALESRTDALEALFNGSNAKVADNALKLGGQLPSYYAKASVLAQLRTEFDALESALNDDVSGKINTWNEIVDFLDEYSGSEDLATILAGMNSDIANVNTIVEGHTSSIGSNASAISTLLGYFTNGVAKKATADASGNVISSYYTPLTTHNALATTVTANKNSIVSLTNNKADKATTLAGYGITDAYTQTQANNLFLKKEGGTISGALTVSGSLSANGGITIPNAKKLTIGGATLEWDGTALKIDCNVYSTGEISTGGAGEEGTDGSGGTGTVNEVIFNGGNYSPNEDGIVTIDGTYLTSSEVSSLLSNKLDNSFVNTLGGLAYIDVGTTADTYLKSTGSGVEWVDVVALKSSLALTKSDVGLGSVTNGTYAGGTKVTLNGSSKANATASFYAPTGAGTNGYWLKSNGSGAPTWAAASTFSAGSATKLADNTTFKAWGQTFFENGKPKDIDVNTVAQTVYVSFRNLSNNGQAGYVGRGNPGGDEIILLSNTFLRFYANGAERMRISSSGNVGIGTSGPSEKLHVEGNIKATGTVTQGSDIRFKDVIEDKTIKIDDLANAPLFTFKWNDGREDDNIHLGTSAQYWEDVAPWLVRGEDFKTLDYTTGAMAGVISLAKKLVEQENRIRELEKKL